MKLRQPAWDVKGFLTHHWKSVTYQFKENKMGIILGYNWSGCGDNFLFVLSCWWKYEICLLNKKQNFQSPFNLISKAVTGDVL